MKSATRLLLPAISLLAALPLFAQKVEFKPYGFIKGDAIFAASGVLSFDSQILTAPQFAIGADTAAVGFTAQHTRLGIRGEAGDDIKAGGLVEVDFFRNSLETNLLPRMRLAYAWLATGGFELRVGQQWDLLSSNNPFTNNTNGNLWYAGNMGFRRGMIQAMYRIPGETFAPMFQFALCEGAQGATYTDNWAGIPMLQGRVSAVINKKFTIGAALLSASFAPFPDSSDLNFSTFGFGADFSLPFDDLFSIYGEFNTGANLKNASLFTIAGPGSKTLDSKNTAFWLNIQSKPHKRVHLTVGLGMDDNGTEESRLAPGAVLGNMVVYGNVLVPFDYGFSLALEAMHITTEYKDGIVTAGGTPISGGDEKRSAMVFNLSGRLAF